MKKMKKLLALLLALAMVFCLAACNSAGSDKEDDEEDGKKTSSKKETIVGEWVCEMDLSDAMAETLEESAGVDGLAPNAKLRMTITFEFTDDGEFEMASEVNESDFKKYMEKLSGNMVDYLYDQLDDMGMSEDEFEEETGMTLEEYVDEAMESAMENAIDNMTFESDTMYYKLDKKAGQIYVAEDEDDLEDPTESFEYELDGEELTISAFLEDGEEVDTPFEQYGIDLPWVFEKQ